MMLFTSGFGSSSKLSKPLFASTCSAFILDPLLIWPGIYFSHSLSSDGSLWKQMKGMTEKLKHL